MWMDQALKSEWPTAKQDRRLSEAISRARVRLWKFIRKRVADQADAEDILQDVFYELMGTYRLIKPIEELRKHRAVLHLRERLQSVYDDFKDLRGE